VIVAGIDYSIRSPAVCVYDTETEFEFQNLAFFAMPKTKKIDGVYDNIMIKQSLGTNQSNMARYDWLGWNCVQFLSKMNVEKVYLENYAFASTGRVFNIGENCGILKHYMWLEDIDVELVAPAALKKFATGKGNAKKDQMIAQFTKDTGVDLWDMFGIPNNTKSIPSPIDDIADAFFLAKYSTIEIEENKNEKS